MEKLDIVSTSQNSKKIVKKFPLPSIDQLLAELDGAQVFTKLDCNGGFYQIVLHEDSQKLTTFITPFWRYCYKRLPFGISSGPDIFHREMTHILSGIPGVICDIDDVLVSGRNQQEHDQRLKMVLQIIEAAGVTLNEKWVFSVHKLKCIVHITSKEGIQVEPDKMRTIAVWGNSYFPEHYRFYGNRNELRNYYLVTPHTIMKILYLQLWGGLFLVLQDSWCLGLLVLETR